MFLRLFLAKIAVILVISSCGKPDKTDDNVDRRDQSGDQQPKTNPKTQTKPDPGPQPKPSPDFNKVIKPNLTSIQKDLVDVFCVSCHQGENPSGKVDLTDLSKYMKGEHGIRGYHGILVKPGKAKESMLVLITKTTNEKQKMPPKSSVYPALNQQQLGALSKWIDSLPPVSDGGSDEPGGDEGGSDEPGGDEGGSDEPGDDHSDHDH